jgi:hypothetical protein
MIWEDINKRCTDTTMAKAGKMYVAPTRVLDAKPHD